jgi:hypothetical protein
VKGHLQLENFSALTPEGVLQDFHATVLLGNMAKVLIAETQEELDEKQAQRNATWRYQINGKTALGLLKDPLIELMFDERKDSQEEFARLKALLIRSKVAIQPDRHYPRHKLKRNRRKFHRNKSSPL